MKKINSYIIEKLKLDKDIKISIDKDIKKGDYVLILYPTDIKFLKSKALNLYIGKVIKFEKWNNDSMIRIEYVDPFINDGGPVVFKKVSGEIYDASAGDNSMLFNKVIAKELLENAIKNEKYNVIDDDDYKDYKLFNIDLNDNKKIVGINKLLEKVIKNFFD